MRRSSKTLSMLMLVVYLTSFGAFGFSANGVAHELDHASQQINASIDHDHDGLHLDAKGQSNPEPLSDTEHELLHAASHCHPILGATWSNISGPPDWAALLTWTLLIVSPADPEPPFRPPRSIFAS